MGRSNLSVTNLTNQQITQLRKGAMANKPGYVNVKIGNTTLKLGDGALVLRAWDESKPNGKVYAFVSVPSIVEIMVENHGGWRYVTDEEKPHAIATLNRAARGEKPKRASKSAIELDASVMKTLQAAIPKGFRLVVEDGVPRLQKVRIRK